MSAERTPADGQLAHRVPRGAPGLVGPLTAVTVMACWLGTLVALLALPRGAMVPAVVLPAVLVRTWLHTGLFITAHDAMHGVAWADRPRANRALGRVAVALYALFPYDLLQREHLRHHTAPASPDDPDWHDGMHPGFLRWYVRFVGHYVRFWQIVGMAAVFNLLQHGMGVSQVRLLAFWVLPSLLSTVQLFYVGTYLPHREPPGGYTEPHRATSAGLPTVLSLMACYHFGYHWEHHARPDVPWWRLPSVRRARRAVS